MEVNVGMLMNFNNCSILESKDPPSILEKVKEMIAVNVDPRWIIEKNEKEGLKFIEIKIDTIFNYFNFEFKDKDNEYMFGIDELYVLTISNGVILDDINISRDLRELIESSIIQNNEVHFNTDVDIKVIILSVNVFIKGIPMAIIYHGTPK